MLSHVTVGFLAMKRLSRDAEIQERKKRKKNEWEKGKMCKEKTMEEKEREKGTEINSK